MTVDRRRGLSRKDGRQCVKTEASAERLACDLQGRVERAQGNAKDAGVLHWKRATTERIAEATATSWPSQVRRCPLAGR